MLNLEDLIPFKLGGVTLDILSVLDLNNVYMSKVLFCVLLCPSLATFI